LATLALPQPIATLVMGRFANVPLCTSAGMGLNAFLYVYSCFWLRFYHGKKPLAMVFICGVFKYFNKRVHKNRKLIIKSIPELIQTCIGGGIGNNLVAYNRNQKFWFFKVTSESQNIQ